MSNVGIDSYRLNKFLGLTKILTLLDYDEFKSYLLSQEIKNYDELFSGFRFYVKSICNNIMESIGRGDFLFLEENIIINRANFHGIPLSKLKNSCQKIVFLKNVKRLFESLYSSKNEINYKENFLRTKGIFISMVDEYISKIDLSKEFKNKNKEEIILNLAIFWNYIDYNDTGKGLPKGYFFSLAESNDDIIPLLMNRDKYLHLFEGYKYTLIYVWDKLLSKEQKTVFPYEMMQTTNWEELDRFFNTIRTRIITPIEKEYRPSRETFFHLVGIVNSIIPKFFFEPAPEPNLTFIEELEQLYLWYPIQALPSEDVFSGASSCVITLEGSIGVKSRMNIDEKVYVIRFIHPEHSGNSYSYAILIDTFSTIGDYSGWLLFYKIGAEYGDFSYSAYKLVEDTLELYPDGFEIIDFIIDTKKLLRYIKSKSFNIKDVIERRKISQETEKMLFEALNLYHESQEENIFLKAEYSSSRGILLELVAYYYFNCKGGNVSLRYKNMELIGQTDIDIISQKDNEILIISCMCSFDKEKIYKLNHIIESLNTKGWEMYDIERLKLKPAIFISKSLTRDQKSFCEQNGISIFALEELMDSEPCFTRITILEVKRILLGK